MNSQTILLPLFLCASIPLFSAEALAQDSAPGTVTTSGVATVKMRPTVLRMRIELSEKKPTAEESVQKIKNRQEAVKLQLEAFGAEVGSIVVSPLSLPSGEDNAEQRMRQMAMYQMQSQGRTPKALQLPKSVNVTSTVTAEWPLAIESDSERLLFVVGLEDKVVEADLAGVKEPKELTPEEEEFQAEMQEMMAQYSYGSNETQPGQPQFVYVAKISDEQRSSALAEAFKQAKAKAQRLADAAGVGLGQLRSLDEGSGAGGPDYASQYMEYAMAMQRGITSLGEMNKNESISTNPGDITFQVTIQATFELE